MRLMMTAVMNSCFVMPYICLRPFILINSTHMSADVPSLRQPWLALAGNLHRSDKETWGICFTTDQHGKREVNERVNKRETESVRTQTEKGREDHEEGVILFCNLVFPWPSCP